MKRWAAAAWRPGRMERSMRILLGAATGLLITALSLVAAPIPSLAQVESEPEKEDSQDKRQTRSTAADDSKDVGLDRLARRVREDPDSAIALARYGMGLVRSGRTEDGLAAIARARIKAPQDVEIRVIYAKGLWKSGYPVQAIEESRRAARSPDATSEQIGEAWFVSGTALMKMGDRKGAEEELRRSIEHAPDQVNALFNLGLVLAGADRFNEGVIHFERAIQIAPTDIKLISSVAAVYADKVSRKKSIDLWERVVNRKPSDTSLLKGLGSACLEAGNYSKALPVFGKLAALDRENAAVRYEFAKLLARFSQLEAALAEAREAEKLGAAASELIVQLETQLGATETASGGS